MLLLRSLVAQPLILSGCGHPLAASPQNGLPARSLHDPQSASLCFGLLQWTNSSTKVPRHLHVCTCVPGTQPCCASGRRECAHAASRRPRPLFPLLTSRAAAPTIDIDHALFWRRLSGDVITWAPSLTQYSCDGIMADDNRSLSNAKWQVPARQGQTLSRVPCWKVNEVCR